MTNLAARNQRVLDLGGDEAQLLGKRFSVFEVFDAPMDAADPREALLTNVQLHRMIESLPPSLGAGYCLDAFPSLWRFYLIIS